jgi:hypothetical protein
MNIPGLCPHCGADEALSCQGRCGAAPETLEETLRNRARKCPGCGDKMVPNWDPSWNWETYEDAWFVLVEEGFAPPRRPGRQGCGDCEH